MLHHCTVEQCRQDQGYVKNKWEDVLTICAAVWGDIKQTCAAVTLCLRATFVITECESFVALQSGE